TIALAGFLDAKFLLANGGRQSQRFPQAGFSNPNLQIVTHSRTAGLIRIMIAHLELPRSVRVSGHHFPLLRHVRQRSPTAEKPVKPLRGPRERLARPVSVCRRIADHHPGAPKGMRLRRRMFARARRKSGGCDQDTTHLAHGFTSSWNARPT